MSNIEAVDREWLRFRETLERVVGVPLGQYKEPQMKRRLASVMHKRGIGAWSAFGRALENDQELLDDVRDTLTINVSEFFRQPDRFAELQNAHLPALLQTRATLKLWSAGCSIGCEPYTLAMIINELDPGGRHSILATDVDLPTLARAREGKDYHPSEVRSVPPAMLKKYFTVENGLYSVTDDVRRRVTFRRHDLLRDSYPTDLDLILCRNVVIYFTEQAKQYIYEHFAKALRPGGLLFIGGSEMIMRSIDLGFRSASMSMYRKAA